MILLTYFDGHNIALPPQTAQPIMMLRSLFLSYRIIYCFLSLRNLICYFLQSMKPNNEFRPEIMQVLIWHFHLRCFRTCSIQNPFCNCFLQLYPNALHFQNIFMPREDQVEDVYRLQIFSLILQSVKNELRLALFLSRKHLPRSDLQIENFLDDLVLFCLAFLYLLPYFSQFPKRTLQFLWDRWLVFPHQCSLLHALLLPLQRNNFKMSSFEIALPSIPTKAMRFKIQDIKSISFGNQSLRFKESKTYLTKKFIESFKNFYPQTAPEKELKGVRPKQSNSIESIESTAQSIQSLQSKALSLSYMATNPRDQFHYLIPEHKRHLLVPYEQSRREVEKAPTSSTEDITSRAYTFPKAYSRDVLELKTIAETKTAQIEQMVEEKEQQSSVQKMSVQKTSVPKPLQKSAVFMKEYRWAEAQRSIRKSNPIGPGQYLIVPKSSEKKSQPKKEKSPQPKEARRIKDILSDLLDPEKENQNQKKEELIPRQSHMFVQDDRDRFGLLKYPIAPPLNIPGPGNYETQQNTIESKVNRILIVSEQRRLLKQWYES